MLDLSLFDQHVIGQDTEDPLRFAFTAKRGAHAAGGVRPVAPPQQGTVWQHITQESGALTPPRRRCLYIHIPFCRVRCTFCNFFQNAASRQLVDRYFSALVQEIKLKAALPWTQASEFHAVYVGGGTPTDLSADQIQQLGELIRSHFPLTGDCEITLEGRINRFSDETFYKALAGGFNRFSFGVQSFNTQVRRAAKRLDERETVLQRLTELSSTQLAPIVIDLLYGLPHQTLAIFEQDLQDFMTTGAHGIDLYQLMVGGDAPMLNLVEKGRLPAPATTPDKASMFALGVEFFDKHHLKTLSVNHWATDNRERSQYNSLAKTYAEVLPIGCGAGGNLGGYTLMQHRQLDRYMEAMEAGQTPIAMMFSQHPLEPMFATLKSGFDAGVLRRADYQSLDLEDAFDYLAPLFHRWQELGLVTVEPNYIVATLAGRFWSVTLAQACIEVLSHQTAKLKIA